MQTSKLRKRTAATTLLDPKIVLPAIGQAFVKLNPKTLAKNPVMFVVYVGTIVTAALYVQALGGHGEAPRGDHRHAAAPAAVPMEGRVVKVVGAEGEV